MYPHTLGVRGIITGGARSVCLSDKRFYLYFTSNYPEQNICRRGERSEQRFVWGEGVKVGSHYVAVGLLDYQEDYTSCVRLLTQQTGTEGLFKGVLKSK